MTVRARQDIAINRWLKAGKTYFVVGLDDQYFRVINERGEPTLFDRSEFEIVDGRIPEDWIRRDETDGTYQIDPPELADHGFYDRLFDGKPEAVERFQRFIEERQLSTAPAPDRFRLPHEKR